MALKSWSSTAASNATVGSINWAENQAPSTVNDSARAVMADVRSWYEDAEWRDWGHTVTRTANTTFTIVTDVTAIYIVNRPIRCTDSSTLYGVIASSSYSAPNTTVTVTLDSGNLSSSLTSVALGMSSVGFPLQASAIRGVQVWCGTATGTVDAIVLTPSVAITSYTTGQEFSFIASGNNTGATTVNISGLGVKNLTKNGASVLVANDIDAGGAVNPIVVIRYDGTRFQIQAQGTLVNLASSQTLTNKTLTSPIINGTATGSGTIGGTIVSPWARMQRSYAENTTSSATLTVDLGTVVAGDIVYLTVSGDVTISSAVNGTVQYLIGKTGTATITNSGSATMPSCFVTTTSADVGYYFGSTFILKVTVGGTLLVGIGGRSTTNCTVNTNTIRITAVCLIGS